MSTYNRFSQLNGRFEIRAKFPTSRIVGLQSALWMYPAVTDAVWPANGEIDIAEWYSQYYNRVIPYLHYATSYLDPNATNVNCVISNVGSWHTYALEWTTTSIKFIYDGKTCMENTAVAGQYPFNKAYMIVLGQLLGTRVERPDEPHRVPGDDPDRLRARLAVTLRRPSWARCGGLHGGRRAGGAAVGPGSSARRSPAG